MTGGLLTLLYSKSLKKKYTLTEETNNYVMSRALEMAAKCRGWIEQNEDWGIKVDAEKLAADEKAYEDSL